MIVIVWNMVLRSILINVRFIINKYCDCFIVVVWAREGGEMLCTKVFVVFGSGYRIRSFSIKGENILKELSLLKVYIWFCFFL